MNQELRRVIYDKCKGRCFYCGIAIEFQTPWHVEHRTPKSKGGNDGFLNLVSYCPTCNIRKGNKDSSDYRDYLVPTLIAKLEDAIKFSNAISAAFVYEKRKDGSYDNIPEQLDFASIRISLRKIVVQLSKATTNNHFYGDGYDFGEDYEAYQLYRRWVYLGGVRNNEVEGLDAFYPREEKNK